MNKNVFSSHIAADLQIVDDKYKPLLSMVTKHSLGYFIADTLNIILYQPHNRKYILHHLLSIFAAVSILYWNSYLSTYGLWSFEIGGFVHHLKYSADAYHVNILLWYIAQILYHSVYVTTRLLTFTNLNLSLIHI